MRERKTESSNNEHKSVEGIVKLSIQFGFTLFHFLKNSTKPKVESTFVEVEPNYVYSLLVDISQELFCVIIRKKDGEERKTVEKMSSMRWRLVYHGSERRELLDFNLFNISHFFRALLFTVVGRPRRKIKFLDISWIVDVSNLFKIWSFSVKFSNICSTSPTLQSYKYPKFAHVQLGNRTFFVILILFCSHPLPLLPFYWMMAYVNNVLSFSAVVKNSHRTIKYLCNKND